MDPAGNKITPLQQMLSSCSGAMLTSLIVTPLDVVKIRLQAQQKPLARGSCFLYCNGLMDHLHICPNGFPNCNGPNVGPPKAGVQATASAAAKEFWYRRPSHFTGTIDALIKIARTEGITSLWSGLPPTLVMAVPATVFYFTVYDQLKYALGYKEGDPSKRHVPVIAGVSARVGTSTLISPIELVRTKLQSEQLSYRQVGAAVSSTIRQSGVLSLWRGLGPTLLRDVPFSGIYWYGYELLKTTFMARSMADRLTFTESFISGATAGMVAGVLTLPFDVVKTHRQVELGQKMVLKVRQSTWTIIVKLYRQGGVGALFAGLVPRIGRVAPSCAIMISTYEFGKQFFIDHNAQKRQKLNKVSAIDTEIQKDR